MDFEAALADPQLSRDKLLMLYLTAVRERFSPAEINQIAPDALVIKSANGEETTVYLENLYRMLVESGESADRLTNFENHIACLGLGETDEDERYSRESVVAIIKDEEYLAAIKTPERLAHEHFVGDLWVFYAVDLPHSTKCLRVEDLEKLSIHAEVLRSLAIENLRNVLPDAECDGEGPWYELSAGVYTASLLLLDDIWPELRSSVDGEIVAVAPARDVLLFTGANSAEGIQRMRQKARELVNGGHHTISETLLRRVNEKWVVF